MASRLYVQLLTTAFLAPLRADSLAALLGGHSRAALLATQVKPLTMASPGWSLGCPTSPWAKLGSQRVPSAVLSSGASGVTETFQNSFAEELRPCRFLCFTLLSGVFAMDPESWALGLDGADLTWRPYFLLPTLLGVLLKAYAWGFSRTPLTCGCSGSPCGKCSPTVKSRGWVTRDGRYESVASPGSEGHPREGLLISCPAGQPPRITWQTTVESGSLGQPRQGWVCFHLS